MADMRVHWWKKTVLPANWKMAQEAFMEGYHVPQTHPQLTLGHPEQYDPDSLVYSVYDGGHSSFQLRPNAQAKKGQQVGVGEVDAIVESVRLLSSGLEAMTLPREVQVVEGMRHRTIPEGSTFGAELVKAIYEYAAGAGIPLPPPDPVALARWGGMFFMFPNYFVLPQYGNALVYRVRPNGDDPESCVFELWSLTIPARGEPVARACRRGPLRARRHRSLAAHPAPGLLEHRSPATGNPHPGLRGIAPLPHLRGGDRHHAPRARPLSGDGPG